MEKSFFRYQRPALTVLSVLLALTVSCITGGTLLWPASVTIDDNNRKAVFEQGRTFDLRLERQGGTGYGWAVISAGEFIVPAGTPEVERPDKSERKTGAREMQVFRFKADKEGSGILELHYIRLWEKGKAPMDKFILYYEIRTPRQ